MVAAAAAYLGRDNQAQSLTNNAENAYLAAYSRSKPRRKDC
jgi:hypothetical protein